MNPLSKYARTTLRDLAINGPKVRFEINNGCVDRLLGECLICIIKRPSPYQVDRGQPRDFVEITDAGRKIAATT